MSETTIKVEGELSSRIEIAERMDELLPLLEPYNNIFIVYDEAVREYAEKVASLAGNRIIASFSIKATETDKNIGTATLLCSKLLEAGAGRDAFLLAVGGGITTDLTGFVASIYKRGIRFGFVPTTLLAQADAAIGGKNGVNFLELKNMVGVIRLPEFAFISPEPLLTLPERVFTSGSAELLKTFMIENEGKNYERAVAILTEIAAAENRQKAIEENSSALSRLIGKAAAIKASIVSRDLLEKGERILLNLGHTFAHAIEHETIYGNHTLKAYRNGEPCEEPVEVIAHGEAVSIGIVLASRLSEKLGLAGAGLSDKIIDDFAACGLPTGLPFPFEDLAASMEKDKKAEEGTVRFVLPRAIGDVVVKDLPVARAIGLLKDANI